MLTHNYDLGGRRVATRGVGGDSVAYDWMEASRCELGLGDGTGLNFVTHRKDIAAAILEAVDHRP